MTKKKELGVGLKWEKGEEGRKEGREGGRKGGREGRRRRILTWK
jgi:hypothetical protein